ncbi:MAG: methionyl-tRNA formyltransferase [Lentisphaerae bacterium]|nr:methionyl-tRNA formyltransferase [Lentisphaerota bacterium]
MGSGALACPLLEGIVAAGRDELTAVVTQPDRAAGRGLHCQPCALKPRAEAKGIPVYDPPAASEEGFVARLSELEPDVIVVACYGQFLKKNLLAVPRLGTINVHPSLLPKYRGASPIQWALANGDVETGVSVLYVTPKMDAGDILAQEAAVVKPEDTAATLEPRLAELGAKLLGRVLDRFRAGDGKGVPQDESQVVYARKLTKEDGRVEWGRTAEEIWNRWRGFSPWPGAYTFLPDGGLLKIHDMRMEEGVSGAEGGTVLEAAGEGLLVAAGTGAVRLTRVQPAGKKVMPGAAFLCGYRVPPGTKLG